MMPKIVLTLRYRWQNFLHPFIAGRIVHTFDHLYFSYVASWQTLLLLFLLGNLQCMAPRNYIFYKIR